MLDLDGCRALHLDGHQPDAAMDYAQRCRKAGILTSLDGGGVRINTHELLGVHRRRHGGRALLPADGQDAGGDARLSQEPRLPDRRRDARRARHALVRRAAARSAGLPRIPVPPSACATPAAPATCFTAPTSIPISKHPQQELGRALSTSPGTPRRSRSSISATRPACRRSTTSRRWRASSIRMRGGTAAGASKHRRDAAQTLIGGEVFQRDGRRRGPQGR